MLKRLLALGAALVVAGPLHAQAIPAERVAERLHLSASTAALVAEVLEEAEREPGFLWGVAAELHRRLTPEQREELLAAHRAARAEKDRADAPGERKGAMAAHHPMLQRMLREIETLTEEQKAQLREVHQQYAPQLRALAQRARQGDIDRAELRRQRAEVQQQITADVQAILTPEQQQRAHELLQEVRQRRGAEAHAQGEGRRQALRERDPEQRRAAMAERQAARDAALGLTAEQRAQIQEQGLTREVLTQTQREIVRIHAVLARSLAFRARD